MYTHGNPVNFTDPSGFTIAETWATFSLLEKIWIVATTTTILVIAGFATRDAIQDFIDYYVPYFPIEEGSEDIELDPELESDLENLEDSALEPQTVDPTRRKPSRGANKRDKELVDTIAKELGMNKAQRRDFGNYVEKAKKSMGRGGANNLGKEGLRELAEEFLENGY